MRLTVQKKKIAIIIAIGVFTILAFVCGSMRTTAAEPVTKTEFALNTICSITIYDEAKQAVINECFQKIKDIEQKMSVDITDSEVSMINQYAGIQAVPVSEDTYHVICAGKKYSETTDGKFDISVGPLIKLWGINKPDQKIPAPDAIKSAVALVDYKKIMINDQAKSVYLEEKGMSLDLGGIAKGYAGDAAAEILRENGIQHAIIDLGGNLIVIGSKPDGTDWNVGIQTPFQPDGEYFAILNVTDKAVVTSGIYQRYFKQNERIYHHIMNTKTGYPVDNGLVSVTVVCKNSVDADALAKAFTMGLEDGMRFIEEQKDTEAIFVDEKHQVYITAGLKNSFKITDNEYKLMKQ